MRKRQAEATTAASKSINSPARPIGKGDNSKCFTGFLSGRALTTACDLLSTEQGSLQQPVSTHHRYQ